MRSDRQQLTHKGTITPITSSSMQKKKKKQERNQKIQQQTKRERQNKTFRLETVTTQTTVKCSINQDTPPLTFKTIMTQFPINNAEAVTGLRICVGRSISNLLRTTNSAFMKFRTSFYIV